MSIKRYLLKIARAAVDMVLNQIAQQMNICQDLVRNPVQQMVNQVMGGIWIGEGADKFVDEVTSLVIPGSERIYASCQVTTQSIHRALEIMDAADNQVRGLVNDLEGVFQNIF